MGSTYMLEGSSSDLSSNVGKRVEVTGTLDTSASGSARTGGTASTGSTAGSTGSTAGSTGSATGSASGSMSGSANQHLRVSSVRVIGSDCSAK